MSVEGEPESEIVAAQDEALQKILHTETANADCVNNLMRQWTIVTKEQHIKRCVRDGAQILFNICKETGKIQERTLVSACTEMNRNKSRRQRSHIVESTSDRSISRDSEEEKCVSIDAAILEDRNVIKK